MAKNSDADTLGPERKSPRNSSLSQDNHLIFVLISESKFNYWHKKVGFVFIRVVMVDSRDGINSTQSV